MEPQINDDDLSPVEENNTEEDNSMILQRHAPWVARPAMYSSIKICPTIEANTQYAIKSVVLVRKDKRPKLVIIVECEIGLFFYRKGRPYGKGNSHIQFVCVYNKDKHNHCTSSLILTKDLTKITTILNWQKHKVHENDQSRELAQKRKIYAQEIVQLYHKKPTIDLRHTYYEWCLTNKEKQVVFKNFHDVVHLLNGSQKLSEEEKITNTKELISFMQKTLSEPSGKDIHLDKHVVITFEFQSKLNIILLNKNMINCIDKNKFKKRAGEKFIFSIDGTFGKYVPILRNGLQTRLLFRQIVKLKVNVINEDEDLCATYTLTTFYLSSKLKQNYELVLENLQDFFHNHGYVLNLKNILILGDDEIWLVGFFVDMWGMIKVLCNFHFNKAIKTKFESICGKECLKNKNVMKLLEMLYDIQICAADDIPGLIKYRINLFQSALHRMESQNIPIETYNTFLEYIKTKFKLNKSIEFQKEYAKSISLFETPLGFRTNNSMESHHRFEPKRVNFPTHFYEQRLMSTISSTEYHKRLQHGNKRTRQMKETQTQNTKLKQLKEKYKTTSMTPKQFFDDLKIICSSYRVMVSKKKKKVKITTWLI
jgi:hypothetical protein